jgi:hypothetical protein
VENLTANPKSDEPANTFVTGFTLSPAGDALAFTATPLKDSQGGPLNSGDSESFNDREVFVVPAAGLKQQITSTAGLKASSPASAPAWCAAGQ